MSIDRRGFIQGLLTAVGGGTALVKLATPAEARALTVHQDVIMRQPNPTDRVRGVFMLPGTTVYAQTSGGGYESIGIITNITVEQSMVDVTRFGGEIELAPGLTRARADFEGWLG